MDTTNGISERIGALVRTALYPAPLPDSVLDLICSRLTAALTLAGYLPEGENGLFTVSRIHRGDFRQYGYDASGLSNGQMFEVVDEIEHIWLAIDAFDVLATIADNRGLPRVLVEGGESRLERALASG